MDHAVGIQIAWINSWRKIYAFAKGLQRLQKARQIILNLFLEAP